MAAAVSGCVVFYIQAGQTVALLCIYEPIVALLVVVDNDDLVVVVVVAVYASNGGCQVSGITS